MLDSSVLVAALRSRQGASFRLLELLRDGQFAIAVSVPLVLEYEAVLVRHAVELNLSREAAVGVVDFVCGVAHRQDIHFLWRPSLTDPQDEFVLELEYAQSSPPGRIRSNCVRLPRRPRASRYSTVSRAERGGLGAVVEEYGPGHRELGAMPDMRVTTVAAGGCGKSWNRR